MAFGKWKFSRRTACDHWLRLPCRQVKVEEGQALAKKLHANFIETSAKDNKNISMYLGISIFWIFADRQPLVPRFSRRV